MALATVKAPASRPAGLISRHKRSRLAFALTLATFFMPAKSIELVEKKTDEVQPQSAIATTEIRASVQTMATAPVSLSIPSSSQLLALYCKTGDKISHGQLVATLQSDELAQRQQTYLNHLEQLQQLKRERSAEQQTQSTFRPSDQLTIEQLRYQKLDRQLQYDREALMAFSMTEAEIHNLIASKKTDGLVTLKAPFDALVSEQLSLSPPAPINAGQAIVTLIDRRILLLEFMVTETTGKTLKTRQRIRFEQNRTARITRIHPSDPFPGKTRIQAIVSPEDSPELSPGDIVRIDLDDEKKPSDH